MAKKLDFVIPAVGGVTGANLSACLGNIGLVGGFGGISVGLVGMTGIGILTSSAIYASLQGLETNDHNVGLALGRTRNKRSQCRVSFGNRKPWRNRYLLYLWGCGSRS